MRQWFEGKSIPQQPRHLRPTMNFNQIVAIVAPEYGRQPEARACPDQYVGRLSQVINQADFPVRLVVNERPDSPCLIMVMESPHIKEFVDHPGPAKGRTGELLRLHLRAAIDCIGRQDMGLILVNSIQYQCTLGKKPKLYRDNVFRAVWASGGQENFKKRLQITYRAGDILMNCCTKGNDFRVHSPLRHLVETIIREMLTNVKSIRRMHPSSWWRPIRRSQEWCYQPSLMPEGSPNAATRGSLRC